MDPEVLRPIVREIRVSASPIDVFPFFTDPEKMVAWHARTATMESHVGGRFRIHVNRDNIAIGEFVEIDPPRRVVFTWGWEHDDDMPPGATRVEVTFVESGSETIVRLEHQGIPHSRRAGNGAGWDHYFERLSLAASGRDPGPDRWDVA